MPEWTDLRHIARAPAAGGTDAGDRIVARRGDVALTAADLQEAVARWQAHWQALPGERVALYFDDAFDFCATLFGAWQAGRQVWLPADRQPSTLQRLRAVTDGWADDDTAVAGPSAPRPALLAPDPDRPCLMVFTSGSTGQPQPIAKTLRQLQAELDALESVFGADAAGTTAHATVSHQHFYGLLFQVLWPLSAGRPFECGRLHYPEQIAAMACGRPALLVASPAQLRRLSRQADWSAARAALRLVFSSGGPLPVDAAQDSAELLGCWPTEILGSSETGAIAWRCREAHADAWVALPGVSWRIAFDRLAVRSPWLETSDELVTQDRVEPQGEHGFRLLGRDDRIAKIGEKRVSLGAIERALLALPDIAEARAFVLEAAGAERVAVAAVPTPAGWERQAALGRRVFNDRLRAELAGTVDPAGLPRRFRLVRALPSNPQGKVTDALLAELFRPLVPAARWLQREPCAARLSLCIDAGLAVFDGHFQDLPVLPGVAQIDWAAGFARQCFALPGRFLRAEQIKFVRPVRPPLDLELELNWRPDPGCLQFHYRSTLGSHASGRLVWGEVVHAGA